jgi:hypothetical protein
VTTLTTTILPFGIEVRAEGYARETLPRIVATADPARLGRMMRP